MFNATNRLFVLAWFFTILVSVVDGYLLLYCRDVIEHTERNPIGVALLAMNDGQVWVFLSLKLLGTILACTILLVLFRRNRRIGLPIAVAIACLQLGLLLYLHLA